MATKPPLLPSFTDWKQDRNERVIKDWQKQMEDYDPILDDGGPPPAPPVRQWTGEETPLTSFQDFLQKRRDKATWDAASTRAQVKMIGSGQTAKPLPAPLSAPAAFDMGSRIMSGSITPEEIEGMPAAQLPFDHGMLNAASNGRLAEVAKVDPEQAKAMVLDAMRKREGRTGFKIGRGLFEGAVDTATFGLVKPNERPVGVPERISRYVGNVLGFIPGIVAAEATGGTLAAAGAARVLPGAARAAEAGGGIARALMGAIRAGGTGATLGVASEAAHAAGDPEYTTQGALGRIGSQAGQYALFGGLSPAAERVAGGAGRLLGRIPGVAPAAAAVAQRAPLAAHLVREGTQGAIQGGMAGGIRGVGAAILNPDEARNFVQNVLQSAGEEASEDIIMAIAFTMATGKMPHTAGAVTQAARQLAGSAPERRSTPMDRPLSDVDGVATPEAYNRTLQVAADREVRRVAAFLNPDNPEQAIEEAVRTVRNRPGSAVAQLWPPLPQLPAVAPTDPVAAPNRGPLRNRLAEQAARAGASPPIPTAPAPIAPPAQVATQATYQRNLYQAAEREVDRLAQFLNPNDANAARPEAVRMLRANPNSTLSQLEQTGGQPTNQQPQQAGQQPAPAGAPTVPAPSPQRTPAGPQTSPQPAGEATMRQARPAEIRAGGKVQLDGRKGVFQIQAVLNKDEVRLHEIGGKGARALAFTANKAELRIADRAKPAAPQPQVAPEPQPAAPAEQTGAGETPNQQGAPAKVRTGAKVKVNGRDGLFEIQAILDRDHVRLREVGVSGARPFKATKAELRANERPQPAPAQPQPATPMQAPPPQTDEQPAAKARPKIGDDVIWTRPKDGEVTRGHVTGMTTDGSIATVYVAGEGERPVQTRGLTVLPKDAPRQAPPRQAPPPDDGQGEQPARLTPPAPTGPAQGAGANPTNNNVRPAPPTTPEQEAEIRRLTGVDDEPAPEAQRPGSDVTGRLTAIRQRVDQADQQNELVPLMRGMLDSMEKAVRAGNADAAEVEQSLAQVETDLDEIGAPQAEAQQAAPQPKASEAPAVGEKAPSEQGEPLPERSGAPAEAALEAFPEALRTVYFATSPEPSEMEAITRAKPNHVLVSFALWQNKNLKADLLAKIGYRPVVLVDSGAWTFRKRTNGLMDIMQAFQSDIDLDPGQVVTFLRDLSASDRTALDVEPLLVNKFRQYLAFLDKNKGSYDYAITADTIGDQTLSNYAYEVMKGGGYDSIPVFHYRAPTEQLQELVDAGADYIALGGTANRKGAAKVTPNQVVAWVKPILEQYPNIKFHLLGSQDLRIMAKLPGLASTDGTAWHTSATYKANLAEGQTKADKAATNINRIEGRAPAPADTPPQEQPAPAGPTPEEPKAETPPAPDGDYLAVARDWFDLLKDWNVHRNEAIVRRMGFDSVQEVNKALGTEKPGLKFFKTPEQLAEALRRYHQEGTPPAQPEGKPARDGLLGAADQVSSLFGRLNRRDYAGDSGYSDLVEQLDQARNRVRELAAQMRESREPERVENPPENPTLDGERLTLPTGEVLQPGDMVWWRENRGDESPWTQTALLGFQDGKALVEFRTGAAQQGIANVFTDAGKAEAERGDAQQTLDSSRQRLQNVDQEIARLQKLRTLDKADRAQLKALQQNRSALRDALREMEQKLGVSPQEEPQAAPESSGRAGVTMNLNQEKNGVELTFDPKPDDATILRLREARWRPAKRDGKWFWYAKQSPASVALAQELSGRQAAADPVEQKIQGEKETAGRIIDAVNKVKEQRKAAAAKEPWQLTKAQFTEQALATDRPYQDALTGTPHNAPAARLHAVSRAERAHSRAVVDALKAGENVPGEVLADYKGVAPAPEQAAPAGDPEELYRRAVEIGRKAADPKMGHVKQGLGKTIGEQLFGADANLEEQRQIVRGIVQRMLAEGTTIKGPEGTGYVFPVDPPKETVDRLVNTFMEMENGDKAKAIQTAERLRDKLAKEQGNVANWQKYRAVVEALRVHEPSTAPPVAATPEEPRLFKKGDRIAWNRDGKRLTGTVRSDVDPGESSVDVQVDQIMRAGGVPIGRLEYWPLNNVEALATETPKGGAGNASEPVGAAGAGTLAGTPAEDVSGPPPERKTESGAEGGRGANEGRVRGADRERSEPTIGVGAGKGGMAVPAERAGRAGTGKQPSEPGGTDRVTKAKATAEEPKAPRVKANVQTKDGGRNYVITDADEIGQGGAKAKYRNNVEAIRIIQQLGAEKRPATPEEQAKLVKYVGWGALSDVFNEAKARIPDAYPNWEWKKEYQELKDLLTKEEWDSARRSTINAHYTAPEVVKAMWQGLTQAGFKGGRILEPSAGVGHFFGLMPQDVAARSHMHGVELDQVTGTIARLLYPQGDVRIQGFQKALYNDNFFDLVISNVPFDENGPLDPRYDKLKPNLHNYFFLKALDKARPGGLVAFITSRYTMDSQDSRVRRALADHADLVAAVRLPNNAFQGNAGTVVTTDLVILRKRAPGERPNGPAWADTSLLQMGGYHDNRGKFQEVELRVNEYFTDNPDQMLGNMTLTGSMYSRAEPTLEPDGRDLKAALQEALAKLPANTYRPAVHKATEQVAPEQLAPRPGKGKNGSYFIEGGKLYQTSGEEGKPVDAAGKKGAALKAFVPLRDAVNNLLRMEYVDATDADLQTGRKQLGKLYDSFVQKHGAIHDKQVIAAIAEDPDHYRVLALERFNEKAQRWEKAAIFSKRTVEKYKPADRADNAKDALSISLRETGRVDLERMAKLAGTSTDDILQELEAAGTPLYRDPEDGQHRPAEEYLSGNVRAKLKIAKAAAEQDPDYAANVTALEAVQPTDLTEADVRVRLGVQWVEPQDVHGFMTEILDTHSSAIQVWRQEITGDWGFSLNDRYGGVLRSAENTATWGTERVPATTLLEYAFNGRQIFVYDPVPGEHGKNIGKVLNPGETERARAAMQKLHEEFGNWLFRDDARKKRLLEAYNDTYNNLRLRTYDGAHLNFPGMNPEWQQNLHSHQRNAIWRGVQTRTSLFAHAVGAGKTFEMIGTAMESKRLGLAKKPLFVVPNHMAAQFADDFLKLYPGAQILVGKEKNFSGAARKEFMNQIATGDWDGIIVREFDFSKLPMSREAIRAYYQETLDTLRQVITEEKLRLGEKAPSVKQLVKSEERLQNALDKKMAALDQDTENIDFEQLGVDSLLVDEAHRFKNLWFTSAMDRVKGLGAKDGSQRAFDLNMKTNFMHRTGGRIVFATGTPLSNSMAEMYTLSRYLDPEGLDAMKLKNFDQWARQFGEVTSTPEMGVDGRYRMVNRFNKFVNLPELLTRYRNYADVRTTKSLVESGQLKIPKLRNGERRIVEIEPSDDMLEFMGELADRYDKLGSVDPKDDNALKIASEARKASLDIRLMKRDAPDDPDSKLNTAIGNIHTVWKETQKGRSTQIVFLDLGTPKAESEKAATAKSVSEDLGEEGGAEPPADDVSVYQEIKQKLMLRGVPEQEIAFVHTAKKADQKLALFNKMNSGEIRVLIGSTEKMGVGTNVQKKLVALHHLDVPWRPADVEQREGRILRQGNENPEVDVFVYATKRSFDVFMWQLQEAKAAAFTKIMTEGTTMRELEDHSDDFVRAAANIRAIASGDPRVLEKINVDNEVMRLQSLKDAFVKSQRSYRSDLDNLPNAIKNAVEEIGKAEHDKAHRPDIRGERFALTIEDTRYTERKPASEAMWLAGQAVAQSQSQTAAVWQQIGTAGQSWNIMASRNGLRLFGPSGGEYQISLSHSDVGTLASMMNSMYEGPETRADSWARRRDEWEKRITTLKEEVKKRFEHDEKLQKNLARQAELDEALGLGKTEAIQAPDPTAAKVIPLAPMGGGSGLEPDVVAEARAALEQARQKNPDTSPAISLMEDGGSETPQAEPAMVRDLEQSVRKVGFTSLEVAQETFARAKTGDITPAEERKLASLNLSALTMLDRVQQAPARQAPPRQAPARQAPPRQATARQAPPRQATAGQAPPRQAPPLPAPPMDAATAEVRKGIKWQSDRQPLREVLKGTPGALGKALDWYWEGFHEPNAPLHRAVDRTLAARRQEGMAVPAQLPSRLDPRLMIENLPKTAPGKAETYWRAMGEGLKAVGDVQDDYFMYADAKRAVTKAKIQNLDDEDMPFSHAAAEALVKRVENGPDAKRYGEALKAEQKLTRQMRRDMVDAGMLTQEAADKLDQEDPYYVPWFRDPEAVKASQKDKARRTDRVRESGGMGQSVVNLGNPIKAMRGSDMQLMDPRERRVRWMARVAGLTERNKMFNGLYDFHAAFDTDGQLMRDVSPPMEYVEGRLTKPAIGPDGNLVFEGTGIMRQLEDLGFDPQDLADPQGVIGFFKPKGLVGEDSTKVHFWRNGKRKWVNMLDEDLLRVVADSDRVTQNFVANGLQKMVQLYKTGATITPSFTAANILRDTWESWWLSKRQLVPGQAIWEAVKVMAEKNPPDPFVQRVIDAGLKQGGWASPGVMSLRAAQQLADPNGLKTPWKLIWKWYNEGREGAEFITRLGEASLEFKALRKEGLGDEDAFIKAFNSGQKITLNFTRKGRIIRELNKYVPFASIPFEAATRVAESVKAKEKGIGGLQHRTIFGAKTILSGLAIGLASAFIGHDDERKQQASDQERDRYVLIPMGKALLRVPKAQGLQSFLINLTERSMREWALKDPDAFNQFRQNAMLDLFPRVTNPALELLVAATTGYDMAQGQPIVPRREQTRPKYMQFDEQTSPTVRKVAGVLPGAFRSPRVAQFAIDKVIPGYSEGWFMLERAFRKDVPTRRLPGLPFGEDSPVVGRFLSRPGEGKQGRSVGLFYDRLDQSEEVYQELRAKIQEATGREVTMNQLSPQEIRIRNTILQAMPEDRRQFYVRRARLKKVENRLSILRKALEATRRNGKLSANEKRREIERFNSALTDLATKSLSI